jgi:hypothetical protein
MQQPVQQRLAQQPQQRQPSPLLQPAKMGLLERVTYGSQHNVFRVAAIVLSSWSALSVYTMFSGNDASPVIKQFMDVSSTVAFVAIGYFVLRGWAHRMKEGKPVFWYVVLSVLYAGFEIACNVSVFSGQASTPWLKGLHDVLLSISPFVKSMMPIFAMSMARVEVDLMAERGILAAVGSQVSTSVPVTNKPVAPVRPQPKSAQNGSSASPAGAQQRAVSGSQQQQSVQRPGIPPRLQPQQQNNQQRQVGPDATTVPDRGRQPLRPDQVAAQARQQPQRPGSAKNPLQGFYQGTRDEDLTDEDFFDELVAVE